MANTPGRSRSHRARSQRGTPYLVRPVMDPVHLLICGTPEPCRGDDTQTCVHQPGDTNWCFTAPDVAVYPAADRTPPEVDRVALADELVRARARHEALICGVWQAIDAACHGKDPLPLLASALTERAGSIGGPGLVLIAGDGGCRS